MIGTPPLKTYGPEDYDADGRNWLAAQDSYGQMYFANHRGLLQFDGAHWTVYPIGATFQSILTDDGVIWAAGTNEFGFFEVSGSKVVKYHSLIDQLPDNSLMPGDIWQISKINDVIYFVAEQHLIRWDGVKIEVEHLTTPRRLTLYQAQDSVLVSQRGAGVLEEVGGEYIPLISNEAINGDAINFISKSSQPRLYGTFRSGFYSFESDVWTNFPTELDSYLTDSIAYQIVQLNNGDIAVGTHTHGILLMHPDGRLAGQIGKQQGLLSDTVFSLFQDRDGNLWACHENGISCINMENSWTMFSTAHDEIPDIVYSFVKWDDELYCGTIMGVYRLSQNTTFNNYEWVKIGENSQNIWHGLHHSQGPLFCYQNGVIAADPEGTRTILETTQDIVYAQSDPTSEVIYLSSFKEILIAKWNQGILEVMRKNSFPGIMWTMAFDNDGGIYLGSVDTGLLYVKRDALFDNAYEPHYDTILNPETGAPFMWAYTSGFAGGGIIAITNDGCFQRNPRNGQWKRIRNTPAELGLDPYSINFFSTDDAYWLTLQSVGVVRRELVKITWPANEDEPQYQRIPSLGLNVLGSIHGLLIEDEKQIAWFGGNGGIVRDQLLEQKPKPLSAPIISSTMFSNGNGPAKQSANHDVSFPVKECSFEFALPYYGDESVKFRTRLRGLGENWSDPYPAILKEYTNLQEGIYVFEVQAIIEGRPYSPISRYQFTVLPPWYRTIGAYIAFIIAGSGAIYAFIHWRTQRLRMANLALENAVRTRTIELEKTNVKLALANTSKNRFLAQVSHEIRNPMNGIVGLAHLMMEEQAYAGDKRLGHLLSTAEQLKILLDGMLDFAAIENGHLRMVVVTFKLDVLLDELESLHRRLAQEKGLTLRIERPKPTCPSLCGDAGKLKQILFNLTTNAIKFTDTGEVAVSAQYSQNDSDDALTLTFLVQDTGRGIPDDDRQKIFDQFHQASNTSNVNKGIGLGLNIADRLTKLLNGKLDLLSTGPEGTCFSVEIPIKLDPESIPTDEPVEADFEQSLTNAHVLVVEDEHYNQIVIQGILEKMGVIATTVSSGEAALAQWNNESWDFVLLDINLPGISGIELARAIRQLPNGKTVPIIAMSAHVEDEHRGSIMEAGVNEFVPKPFSPLQLMSAIHSKSLEPTKKKESNSEWNALKYMAGNDSAKLQELTEELWATVNDFCDRIELKLGEINQEEISSLLHQLTPSLLILQNPDASKSFLKLQDCINDYNSTEAKNVLNEIRSFVRH
ncbi:hybrid sensor histidine kinase/response regulator [Cerasicoccus arenae]|nr:response regulator [Cerasicoccus arenae]